MIDGHGWRREGDVRETACRDGNDAGDFVDAPKHGGAAIRAKTVGDVAAVVADSNEFSRLSLNCHVVLAKPGAKAECAAGFPLTSQAVAHGYAERFSGARGRKLAARTFCSASGHRCLLSASVRGANRALIFAMPGELGGDAIDQLDSREATVLGDLEHRAARLFADFRDRLARFRRAIQFRLCQLGEMLEVFLAQMRAAASCQCRDVAGVEL